MRLIFSLGVFYYSLGVAYAHGGKGPHGGTVSDFGSSHLEAVLDGGKVNFFVIDSDNKPASITSHGGGTLTLVYPGKGTKVIKIPAGTGFNEYSVPNEGTGKVSVKFKLLVEGKSYSASFQLGK